MRTPPEHTQNINSGLYKKDSKNQPKPKLIRPHHHTKAMWSRGPIILLGDIYRRPFSTSLVWCFHVKVLFILVGWTMMISIQWSATL
jgi:hypothetical protein